MIEKPKGNIYYEILVVILTIILIGTIIYPSSVWKGEDTLQDVCRNRMETIHKIELLYLSKLSTYSDSLPKVINEVLSDPYVVGILDTVVFWDGLTTREFLKQVVKEKQFPEELRRYILEIIRDGKPLGRLAGWDSLGYRLIAQLREVLVAPDSSEITPLDSGIVWPVLLGEETFWNIIDMSEMPSLVRTRTRTAIIKGKQIFETRGLKYMRPIFYDSLQSLISWAEREDVWLEEQQNRWEEERHYRWDRKMDMLSPEEKDSLWQEYSRRFWEKEKELIWKKERNKLWKQERIAWKEDNVTLWRRILSQQWAAERKKKWEEENEDMLNSLRDTTGADFTTKRDSLWRRLVNDLHAKEYNSWEKKNKKYVAEVIQNMWERDRRVTWEDEAYNGWLIIKEADRDATWDKLKEELWNLEMSRLWREEQIKVSKKRSALRKLDQAVVWMNVLGTDRIEVLVNRLNLPDTQELWKKIQGAKKEKVASLYNLGIVGLFREALLDFLSSCPIAHEHFLIIVDTLAMNQMEIRCPILDKTRAKMALRVDPLTKDTVKVPLKLPVIRKLLGGASIKNHGSIDKAGKKSWERRGR